jgi:type II secretion system protein C
VLDSNGARTMKLKNKRNKGDGTTIDLYSLKLSESMMNFLKKIKFGLFILIPFIIFLNSVTHSFQGPAPRQDRGGPLPSLTLVGVVFSKDASSSIAILKNEQTGQTIMLHPGEKILDLTLSQVLENHVVFKRDSQTFTIYLGRGRMIQAQKPSPEMTPAQVNLPETGIEPEETEEAESGIVRLEFDRAEMEKRIEAEMTLIMKESRFVPNMEDGVVSGFRIINLPSQSVISRVGIRKNDIIKKINDVELNSVEGLFDLYMRFKDESRFEVTIERNGRTFRILYTLK